LRASPWGAISSTTLSIYFLRSIAALFLSLINTSSLLSPLPIIPWEILTPPQPQPRAGPTITLHSLKSRSLPVTTPVSISFTVRAAHLTTPLTLTRSLGTTASRGPRLCQCLFPGACQLDEPDCDARYNSDLFENFALITLSFSPSRPCLLSN
jgi:hypothetical protein